MNYQTGDNLFATREQELLLQAALLKRESALGAWRNWKALVNLEQELDMGSYRLLPLAYHNLGAFGVDDPPMSKLRGIHHLEWYKNQMLFRSIAEVLHLFHAAGIETMILKGAAMVSLYYKDYGLRPMSDFDVLVPTLKRDTAINVLIKDGWRSTLCPSDRLTDNILNVRQSVGFENANHRQFDLHWHLLIESRSPNADDDFWADSLPVQFADVSTRILNPTDQLLHTCVHGIEWNQVPAIRWIADSIMILNKSRSEIDWPRLLVQAEKRRLTVPLRRALTYLCDSFNAAIPMDVLAEMSKVRVSDIELKLYNTAAAKPGLLGGLRLNWYRHSFDLEVAGGMNWAKKLISFPGYLLHFKAMNIWQLLIWSISRAIFRIRETVRG